MVAPPRRLATLLTAWFSIGILWWSVQITSASSSNYSPFQYDYTTPLFTPDGRLLQLEYAAKAVDDHASPLLAIPLNETVVAIVAFTRQSSALQRLVVFPASDGEPAVLVAISGVLPDGLALLRKVQDFHRQQQHLQQTGRGDNIAPALAQIAAAACHRHAMGGGVRPYGARLTFVQGSMAWITDPSGAIRTVALPQGATDNKPMILSGDLALRNVVTGGGDVRDILRRCRDHLHKANPKVDCRVQVVLCSRVSSGSMYPLSQEWSDRLLWQEDDNR